jgi:hypothetical protein
MRACTSKRAILVLTLGLVAGACSPGVSVPRPNAEPAPPVPAPARSTIRVPVVIDLSPTLTRAEQSVPRELKASKDWTVVDRNVVGDVGLRFEAVRDPLGIEVSGQRLVARSRVRYWIEVAQRVTRPLVGGSFWQDLGSCGRGGEAPREVEVGLESQLGHNGNWQLTSKTTVRAPTFTNQCRMTFLKVNVTDRVAGAFTQALERAASMVDQQIARQGSFRPLVERAWKQLQTPIALDSGFTLALNPTGAGLLSFEGSDRTVTAVVGVAAQPVVALGTPTASRAPLTGLASSAMPDGFHVSIDGELTFAELNRQLGRRLVGTTQKVGGRSVKVISAEAYGSGPRVVLGLGLAGDVEGTVYFVGTPRYDVATAMLSLDDIDYSLETREALLNVADWLYHEGFRSTIAQQARWGLGRGIAQVRPRLEKALNRELAPGIRSVASVSDVRPVGVFVTASSLRARVVVTGSLRLEVR